jgi:hypothetical protein
VTQKDFEDLFACLMRHGVKALIVGAHAVAFHAKPRFTKDIDILVEPTLENAQRLVSALEELGFGGIGLKADDFVAEGRIVQLGFPPSRVDLITSISGVTFRQAWDGRVTGAYGSQEALYIGKAELIRAKQAAGRPQDLADVATLTDTET